MNWLGIVPAGQRGQARGPRMKDFLVRRRAGRAGHRGDVVPLVDENRVLVRHGWRVWPHAPTLGLPR